MYYKELQNLFAQLLNETSCNNCGSDYTEDDIAIIGSLKDEVFLHLACPKCDSNAMVNAIINRYKINRKHSGLKIRHLGDNISPITANEVIEIHNFLETFDGDFKELFSI